MELVSESIGKNRGVLVCPDIEPFKSIVDGTIITGRAALREHNLRNNVTFTEDYREEWKAKQKIRNAMYTGDKNFDRKRRVEHIVRAVEKHTRRR